MKKERREEKVHGCLTEMLSYLARRQYETVPEDDILNAIKDYPREIIRAALRRLKVGSGATDDFEVRSDFHSHFTFSDHTPMNHGLVIEGASNGVYLVGGPCNSCEGLYKKM